MVRDPSVFTTDVAAGVPLSALLFPPFVGGLGQGYPRFPIPTRGPGRLRDLEVGFHDVTLHCRGLHSLVFAEAAPAGFECSCFFVL